MPPSTIAGWPPASDRCYSLVLTPTRAQSAMQDQGLRPNNLQPEGTGFAAQKSVKTAETGCSIRGLKLLLTSV
jgi:hypothetical protein